MSQFSSKQTKELQQLFREELGLEVSEKDACMYATQLVDLLCETYKENIDFSDLSPP